MTQLDPSDIAITTDAQRQALADLVNDTMMHRSAEIEVLRGRLWALLAPHMAAAPHDEGCEGCCLTESEHDERITTNTTDYAELWKQLRLKEAELLEALAQSDAIYDTKLNNALANVRSRLAHLKSARAIRDQVSAIEDIGKRNPSENT